MPDARSGNKRRPPRRRLRRLARCLRRDGHVLTRFGVAAPSAPVGRKPLDRHARVLVVVGAAALLSAVLAPATLGVLHSQPSRRQLHQVARKLMPSTARVVRMRDASCGEGLRFPSCVEVFFQIPGSVSRRSRAFLGHARRGGWKTKFQGTLGGAKVYQLRRGIYRVGARFWLDRYYRPKRVCHTTTTNSQPITCADYFELRFVIVNR